MPFAITYYHLVWTTFDRAPIIDRDHLGPALDSLDETVEKLGCKLYALSVLPDHVHLALSIPPRHAVAEVVRQLKNASDAAINQSRGVDEPVWDRAYGVITFGTQNKDKVVRYVKRQWALHAEGALIDALEKVGE